MSDQSDVSDNSDQFSGPTTVALEKSVLQDTPLPNITKVDIKAFVEAAHGNLTLVQQLLAAQPELLNQPNGNETALGAACQMRRTDIIEFLLSQGAPLTLSAACVLGQTEKVAELIAADPSLLSKGDKQSHNKHPIYFAENQPETLKWLQEQGAK